MGIVRLAAGGSLSLLVAAGVGCGSKAAGTLGGPCYGNDTCNGGLVCLSMLCVSPGSGGPGWIGAGGTGGHGPDGTGGEGTGTGGATAGRSGAAADATGNGGATGSGGAGTGGVGGQAARGAGADGGALTPEGPADAGQGADAGVVRTAGCGVAPLPVGLGNPFTVDVTYPPGGTPLARQFYVSLPADYDRNRPYRLMVAFHAETSSAVEMVGQGFLGIQPTLPDAIYVAPQAATQDSPLDWPWTTDSGRDIAFATALIPWTENRFCVDPARIMSVGVSNGAILTDYLGCHMSATFRAIATVNGPTSTEYVSEYESFCQKHDDASWSAYFDHFGALVEPVGPPELFRDLNHCATLPQQITPPPCSPSDQCDVNPPSCYAFDDCDVGYPVSYCFGTGDTMPTFISRGMATFFSQF